MKTTLIFNHEYEKLRSATNILRDFCYVQIYCTFGCTSKSQNWKWHRIQRAPWSSYRGVFTRETVTHLCQMMVRYKLFVFVSFLFLSSVIKFDKKCANSTRSPNSWSWPLFLQSKIYSPRQGYLSPGNSIVLEIVATLLFISVTIFWWFWGSFCWNSSTLPTDLFIFVNPSCLQSTTTKILSYHISTDGCKFVKLENYTTWY